MVLALIHAKALPVEDKIEAAVPTDPVWSAIEARVEIPLILTLLEIVVIPVILTLLVIVTAVPVTILSVEATPVKPDPSPVNFVAERLPELGL